VLDLLEDARNSSLARARAIASSSSATVNASFSPLPLIRVWQRRRAPALAHPYLCAWLSLARPLRARRPLRVVRTLLACCKQSGWHSGVQTPEVFSMQRCWPRLLKGWPRMANLEHVLLGRLFVWPAGATRCSSVPRSTCFRLTPPSQTRSSWWHQRLSTGILARSSGPNRTSYGCGAGVPRGASACCPALVAVQLAPPSPASGATARHAVIPRVMCRYIAPLARETRACFHNPLSTFCYAVKRGTSKLTWLATSEEALAMAVRRPCSAGHVLRDLATLSAPTSHLLFLQVY
jgi:hypothetical protein